MGSATSHYLSYFSYLISSPKMICMSTLDFLIEMAVSISFAQCLDNLWLLLLNPYVNILDDWLLPAQIFVFSFASKPLCCYLNMDNSECRLRHSIG